MPPCQPAPRLPSLQYEKDASQRVYSEDPRAYMNDPDYVPTQDVEELYKRFDDLVSEASNPLWRTQQLGGILASPRFLQSPGGLAESDLRFPSRRRSGRSSRRSCTPSSRTLRVRARATRLGSHPAAPSQPPKKTQRHIAQEPPAASHTTALQLRLHFESCTPSSARVAHS